MLVETPIGTVDIVATDANHLHVCGGVTVRGKEKRVSAHYYRWTDGAFHLGEERKSEWQRNYESCYLTENSDTTPAYRKKVIETLDAVVPVWVASNADAIEAAKQKQAEDAVKARQALMAKHQKAIQDLQAEIDRITSGETLPTHSSVAVEKY